MPKNKEYELAIKIAGEIEKSFYESTKLTKKELQSIAREAVQTGSMAAKFWKGLEGAEPAFRQLEKVSDATFSAIKAGAAAAAAAVSGIATASMAVGMNFEEQMSTVQAISMSSGEEMEALCEEAKALGRATKFSAAEVGQGFEYMAMAGWKTEDMLAGIDGVLSLAAASGEDLGAVSDIVTDAMTAFGMGADEVNRFADVLAVAASSSNTNVSMMGETFKYVAPLAGALKYSAEDTALAIGLMANSGIKASQAGTALRSMLSRLTKPTKEVREAMQMLDLSLTDENGDMKTLLQLQKDIREGFKGMDPSRASEAASKLAGQEAMSGLLAIVNATEEDFDSLTEAINNSAGAAEKMAGIRIDNLKGDLTILRSAAEGFGIEMYEGMSGLAREAVQYATGFLGELTESASKKLPTARREIIQFSQGISELAGPVITLGKWLADNPGAIVGPIAGIGTAVTAYKAASGVASLAGAITKMTGAGWALMGIGGVVGLIAGIGTAVKKSAEEAKRANLDAHFGDISLSLKDLQETASFIVHSESLDQIRDSVAALGELDGISQDIKNAADELNKANWKVSIGMELTDQEKESYQSQAEEFVRATQEYVTQRQYGVSLAVTTLLGGDLESNNVVDQINAFYSGKQAELASLGTELNKVITDAFTDGLLDMDEVTEIAKLQEQMAHIKSALAGSDFEAGLDLIGMKYTGQALDSDSFINLQAEIQEQMEIAAAAYDEAFKTSMSEYRMMLSEGEWTQAEFDSAAADLNAGYLQQKTDLQAKAIQFQIDTIRQAYGGELDGVIADLQAEVEGPKLGEMLEHVAGGGPNAHIELLGDDIMDSIKIDQSTRAAMAELFEQMKPEMEELQAIEKQCREAGQAVPEAVRKGLSEMGTIGALAGDMDALWALIGVTAQSPEYQDTLMAIRDAGGYIPEELANAILDNQDVINGAIVKSWMGIQQMYSQTFGSGAGISIPINVGAESVRSIVKTGHSDGGIFNTPHVAWFAENGPEAAIPIDGSRNAIDLWRTTGELLGMDGLTGGKEPIADSIDNAALSSGFGQSQFVFSPTLQFYGDSPSKEDIEDVLETEQEKFARMFEQYMKDNIRLSFR